MSSLSEDKRRFFRIIDYIGLCYTVHDKKEYNSLKIAYRYTKVPSLDKLSTIDQELQLVIDRLKIKNKDVAQLVDLLNSKIDLLLQNSSLKDGLSKLDNIPRMQVDISACGLAFPARGPLEEGQLLEMDLMLQDGKQHLQMLSRVISSQKGTRNLSTEDDSFTHLVRVEFIEASEQIQEFLIQYVVKRQGALLKEKREGGSSSKGRLR